MMNASRRCPAYSDATPSSASRVSPADMALEDGDVDPEMRRVERDGRGGGQQGRGARPGQGLAQREQRLAQAGLSLARRGVRPEEPLDLLAIVRLPGVKREVRQKRLRLPGGQVNRRRADAAPGTRRGARSRGLRPAARRAPAHAARCRRGGGRVSSRCPLECIGIGRPAQVRPTRRLLTQRAFTARRAMPSSSPGVTARRAGTDRGARWLRGMSCTRPASCEIRVPRGPPAVGACSGVSPRTRRARARRPWPRGARRRSRCTSTGSGAGSASFSAMSTPPSALQTRAAGGREELLLAALAGHAIRAAHEVLALVAPRGSARRARRRATGPSAGRAPRSSGSWPNRPGSRRRRVR